MKEELEITRANRKMLEKILDTHSLAQLNKVPEGFSNNIIWNIAHTIVTQQLLVYKLSGLSVQIDEEMVHLYKKGTKAVKMVTQEEVDTIRALLFTTLDKTQEDIDSDIFKEYKEYTTSPGIVLRSVMDAIAFNNYHGGIHIGYILALKKSL